MNHIDLSLLDLLRCGLCGMNAADPGLTRVEWQELFQKAELHKLLPLILDRALRLPSLLQALSIVQAPAVPDSEGQIQQKNFSMTALREDAVQQACRQAIQENEFLNLILDLRARGLEPLVVKGAVCRALYPQPLLRPSVDDDLLILPEQASAFHEALLELGLNYDTPEAAPETLWELSYHKPGSPLYIELHTRLFDPESPAFSGWNAVFADAASRAVPVQIQDVTLQTMAPTDHLLFLILHAFKHFLHSGFGLRIVSDIALFAQAYGSEIDFGAVRTVCERLNCLEFTAAVFRIAEKYLDIPAPAVFGAVETDEEPLLADVLDAGIHGQDIDRLHSSNITLQTVADDRQGLKPKKSGLRSSLFLPASRLKARYPFLERRPWLLPVAWTKRVLDYLRERRQYDGVHPTASLRIGRERVALLEKYHIINQSKQNG